MKRILVSAAALIFCCVGAFVQAANAPENQEKLSNFQIIGATEFTYVDQHANP